MLNTLRICLLALGASAVAIAGSVALFGAAFTAAWAESLFALASGWRGPATGPWPPSMDSELRFYAALWGGYGLVALRTAVNLPKRLADAPTLAAVFFAGGVGRLLSRLSLGPPHPLFTALMVIELALPVVLIAAWWSARRRVRPGEA